MRLRVISIAFMLIWVVCVCASAVELGGAQPQGAEQLKRKTPSSGQLSEAEKLSAKIDAKIRRDNEEEEEFVTNFLSLPPEERVKLWKEGKDITGRGLIPRRMDDALIARGVDAVHYLAEVVRKGDSYHRAYALKILCDMDRFVPLQELPVPEVGDSIYVKALKLGGRLNPFMAVDGRRIGIEGYGVVKWAAEQIKEKDLRFHARQYSGLLERDLRQLSLDEQIKQWKEAVIKSKGVLGVDIDAYNLSYLLKAILIEKAPESIPPLIGILENDSNGYVREEALTVIAVIDTFHMRLRATEVGEKAIETIHRAVERGGLKPVHTTREELESLWKQVSAEVFNDEVAIHNGSHWSVIAMALEKFYGVHATKRYNSTPEIVLIEAIPEMRRFVTYLTKVDPFFPSWEYTFLGGSEEVMHPRFKQKVARYYEQWKKFKAEQPSR